MRFFPRHLALTTPAMLPGLLLWLACLSVANAQTCSASQLGNPCAQGDVASQGNISPGDNLAIGNPIHLATGNKYLFEPDVLPTPQAPLLALARHYNSLDPRHGPLGRGWALNYDVRLSVRGHQVQILQADGSRVSFPLPGPQAAAQTSRGKLHRHRQGWVWHWPNGQQLRFDSDGWLIAMQAAIPRPGVIQIRRHDAGLLHGRIATLHDEQGRAIRLHYRVAAEQAYLDSVDAPLGRWQYHYDAPGPGPALRLTAVTRPDGMQRRYLYDAHGQSGNAWLPTGIAVANDAQAQAHPVRAWRYDPQGRVIQAWQTPSSPENGTVQLAYPAIARNEHDGHTAMLGAHGRSLNWHTRLTQGRYRLAATTLRLTQGSPIAPEGWPELVMAYDAQGRRTYWHSPLTGQQTLHYDHAGRLAQVNAADGTQWLYQYDDQHTLQSLHAQQGEARETTRLTWQNGRVTQVAHPAEQEKLEYDEQGRIRRREILRPPLPDRGQQALHYREHFEYDAHGQLVEHHLPEGGSLHYQWSPQRQLLQLSWLDRQGQRHPVWQRQGTTDSFTHGNGLHTRVHRQGRRLQWIVFDGHHPRWAHLRQHDAKGWITHLADWFGTQHTGQGWRLHYDRAERLSRAEPVTLPPALLRSAPPIATSHTPRESRHHHWYAWHADGGLAATHHQHDTHIPDIARNASGLPRQVGALQLGYSPAGRLVQATNAQGRTAHYTHNAHGYRISASHGPQTRQYLYIGHKLVAEIARNRQFDTLTPTGATDTVGSTPPILPGKGNDAPNDAALTARHITRRYLHAGHAVVGLIDYDAEAPDGRLYAVHTDPLGLPRMLSDDQKRIRWLASHTPTGQLHHQWGDMHLDLRLPGQIADAFTGWHDNLLRTYDPATGAYLEPDPLGPQPGQQARGYASQQPQRYIDPSGLILFAFDGTRQNAHTRGNVWKLAQRYADGAVHYHAGPGNPYYFSNDALVASHADRILDTQWQRLLDTLRTAPATETQVIDLIGYSRGAALARHFGNLIIQHTEGQHFRYDLPGEGSITACIDLRFLGLFDTVAQFGLHGALNHLYDFSIHPAWGRVVHAVALHEYRDWFPLTSTIGSEMFDAIETPFIGAHANIGGGQLWDSDGGLPSDPGDLANVALNWMLWQARAAGVGWLAGPLADNAVTQPILHDHRPSLLRRLSDGDRRVDDAFGQWLMDAQGEVNALGDPVRTLTEAFIRRFDDWRARDDSAVGSVNMVAYAQWLHDTLGWTPP